MTLQETFLQKPCAFPQHKSLHSQLHGKILLLILLSQTLR